MPTLPDFNLSVHYHNSCHHTLICAPNYYSKLSSKNPALIRSLIPYKILTLIRSPNLYPKQYSNSYSTPYICYPNLCPNPLTHTPNLFSEFLSQPVPPILYPNPCSKSLPILYPISHKLKNNVYSASTKHQSMTPQNLSVKQVRKKAKFD